jgi:predicted phage-related endonuclease
MSSTIADATLHRERKNIIGGSDVGSLWNLDFGCRRKLQYEKSGTPADFPSVDRPEFERGKYMEEVVARLYADKTGRKVEITGLKVHPEYPWMGVHMDRVVTSKERPGPGYLEIKVVNWRKFKEFKRTGLRDSYILQVQHGLAVTGFQWGSYGLLCLDPWEFKWFDVERDEELINKVVEAERQFMADAENKAWAVKLEPDDGRCATCQYRATCQGEALTIAGDLKLADLKALPELLPIAAEYNELSIMEKDCKAMQDECKKTAMELMGKDAEGAKFNGGYARWINLKQSPDDAQRRSWDTKALTAMYQKGTPRLKELMGKFYRPKEPPTPYIRFFWTGDK